MAKERWDVLSGELEDIRQSSRRTSAEAGRWQTARGPYVAPRTPTEEHLSRIFSETLAVERLGVEDDFFALGGSSLLAVSLISRAQRELGLEVPLGTAAEHPTIQGLLGALEAPASAQSKGRHLVTLTRGSTRPPLVLMSGLGGYAFVFQGLARFLGEQQPMHVLNAIGADDESEGLHHSIEEMAATYEAEILEVCPSEPLVIGGYSFGMLVGFEIARRFQRSGRPVPLLISFDGFAPGFPRLLPLPGAAGLAPDDAALRRSSRAARLPSGSGPPAQVPPV